MCLQSRNPKLRERALITLFYRRGLRWEANLPAAYQHQLGRIATNRKELPANRVYATQLLGHIARGCALVYLRQIIYNEQDDLGLRGDAVEQMSYFSGNYLVSEYARLLANEHADIRFWAAYCLAYRFWVDPSPALAALDQVVAYDHTVPQYFGWQVDREALPAYERAYFQSLFPKPPEMDADDYHISSPVLVSPAPEYYTFYKDFRVWHEGGLYETKPTPPIMLKVEPDWFAAQLKKRWRKIELNVREPRPAAYLVDFKLTYRREKLIGGLHRDGYGLVLTGDWGLINKFAAWYRSIIDPAIPLYLYTWADPGELLELPS